eukprot:CFRG8409T1
MYLWLGGHSGLELEVLFQASLHKVFVVELDLKKRRLMILPHEMNARPKAKQNFCSMKSTAVITGTVIAFIAQDCAAQMTDEYRQYILSEHNRLRATVDTVKMFELEYDEDLECAARTFVERSGGTFSDHNQNRLSDYQACAKSSGREPEFDSSTSVGENWYSGSPKDSLTGGAAAAWVDFVWPAAWGGNDCSERQSYAAKYNDAQALQNEAINDSCKNGVVGHYTQVLWDRSQKIGCWYTESFGTVCNYGPAGNYNGMKYATYGVPCSDCPSGTVCRNGLCSFNADNETNPTPLPETNPTPFPETNPTPLPSTTIDDQIESFVKTTFTIAGNVGEFDSVAFVSKLASILDVSIQAIRIVSVSEGSIVVETELSEDAQTAMSTITPEQQTSMLSEGVEQYETDTEITNLLNLEDEVLNLEDEGLSAGIITGICVGAGAGLLGLVGVGVYAYRRKTMNESNKHWKRDVDAPLDTATTNDTTGDAYSNNTQGSV